MRGFFLTMVVLILLLLGTTGWFAAANFMAAGMISQSRPVSSFHELDVAGNGTVTIKQGTTDSLTVASEADLASSILTDSTNGVLTLNYQRGALSGLVPRKPVTFTVTATDLRDLRLSGASDVIINGIHTDQFSVTVRGSGNVTLDNLEANSLSVSLSGSGNIHVSGNVNTQNVMIYGGGSYLADQLNSKDAIVNVTRYGSATVRAKDTLNAQANGFGVVDYLGSPRVTDSTSGFAKVTQRQAT
jgi:hypothetical protein